MVTLKEELRGHRNNFLSLALPAATQELPGAVLCPAPALGQKKDHDVEMQLKDTLELPPE